MTQPNITNVWLKCEIILVGDMNKQSYKLWTISCFASFWLVWFYDISTTVGYLMRNLVYLYILDIYDL